MNTSAHDSPDDPTRAGGHGFEATHWSMVLSARADGTAKGREALAKLCEAYWFPLYAFVRRKGYGEDVAQDLVQGFFARLLEKGDLAAVERGKGKFRSFLMAACTHYLANQLDHDRAQKRGGGRPPISIDGLAAEGRYGLEPSHTLTAERLFERQWALTLIANVMAALESEMTAAGKTRQFEALRPALLGEGERTPYRQIAAELGVTEEAARASAHRLRGRYRELFRREVASTLGDPSDLVEEIRSLLGSLED